jgi:DNA (cytosine-5)-methyltransferase 1
MTEKPPYIIPTMAEIARMPLNGYEAISSFSGAGGSSLGYRMAGFKVLWANEFVKAAQDTYKANFKDTFLDHRDIRTITVEDLLATIEREPGQIDLFDGSPPCAAFSMSGKRSKQWSQVRKYSDTKQRVDDLFFEYARILKGVQPRVFVAENVQGLVRGVAKGMFKEIIRELKKCGYNVKAKVLYASWLGVPTTRPRIFFIGVRNDLGLEPVFPRPLAYQYTLRDAIPWLDLPDEHPDAPSHEGEPISMAPYKVGKRWDNLAVGEQDKVRFNLVRCDPDKPVQTVTQRNDATCASVTHPFIKRKFSIAELKRISSFPDDFILTGDFKKQSERLGRAVPPLVMKAIAGTIATEILERLDS